MRNLIFAAALLAASAAVPAAAQFNQSYGDYGIRSRIERLQQRIQDSVASGRLTRGEAESLRSELRQLRQLERQYSQDGLSPGERQELQRRIQSLQQRIGTERRDGEYRDRDGDGQYDRDDRRYRDDDRYRDDRYGDDRYGDDRYREDRYRDDRYRDDRYRDDRYGNSYGRPCPPGLARRDNGCLPPGQVGRVREGDRYQQGMGYELPERYRYQFRDTERYFHRYMDGRILRIDRRTLIIVAIIVVVR